MKSIFTNNFYSKFQSPNKEELLEKCVNCKLHADQKFSWGNGCILKKERLDVQEVSNVLIPSLKQFLQEMGINYDVEVHDVWKNTYEKGNFQEIHYHPNHDLTAVVFLDDHDDNFGIFYFYNRNGIEVSEKWTGVINSFTYYIQGNAGDVLFFPSHMLHGVTPHLSDKERRTVSFNLNFV